MSDPDDLDQPLDGHPVDGAGTVGDTQPDPDPAVQEDDE